ncbi:LIM and SH3 domain protein 1 isoform X28 [Octopus sinensis]|uniref:LIM and SH3 domain protein 1 isoform X28 n=1 Tax=Octopus sinensis TaxID=2607531 RepID=A0A7E6EX92_9MOLL|nr:LIM and SH3 domain protein 1 isoform X28 [Octopus sinensis]
MNKRCGRCSKPVYPTEELKCLDKVWHKSCFKCEVCGMTLNMKNYKGYDKKPFCVAHYPTTKFTSVADTPENRRIATNTKIQSSMHYRSDFTKLKGTATQVTVESLEMKRHAENAKNLSAIQYHSDFEKQKGSAAKMTADSIEMKRHLENAKNASMIKYHEDFEKQKGKLITIADDPELQRIKQNTQIQSEISYKGIKQTRDFMEQRRPDQAAQDGLPPPPPMSSTTAAAGGGGSGVPTIGSIGRPGKISDYDPYQENSSFSSPYSAKSQATTIYDSRIGQVDKSKNTSAAKTVEKVAKGKESSKSSKKVRSTVENGSSRRIGSIADYDPMNNQYGSLVADQERKGRVYDPAPAHHQNPYAGKGLVSKAIYDYSAADTDEVSFMEGDIIIHCQPIDQGWMEGTVERTGERGMLPSNYVQTQSA